MKMPSSNPLGRALTRTVILCLVLIGAIPFSFAAEVEFHGTPVVQVHVSENSFATQQIEPRRAKELEVVIVRTEGGFIWASRNNVRMEKIESGQFVTYVATNGSGYVKILLRQNGELQQGIEVRLTYVEHLTIGLTTITYYGR